MDRRLRKPWRCRFRCESFGVVGLKADALRSTMLLDDGESVGHCSRQFDTRKSVDPFTLSSSNLRSNSIRSRVCEHVADEVLR